MLGDVIVIVWTWLGWWTVLNVVSLLLARELDRFTSNRTCVFLVLITGCTMLFVNEVGLLYRCLLMWLVLMMITLYTVCSLTTDLRQLRATLSERGLVGLVSSVNTLFALSGSMSVDRRLLMNVHLNVPELGTPS